MHHPVAERRGGDLPALRAEQLEETIRAGLAAPAQKLFAQREQFALAIHPPRFHVRAAGLAAPRFPGGEEDIVE